MDEVVLERMVQVGTVMDVDVSGRKARVKFADTGIISSFLSVVQHAGATVISDDHATLSYWLPKVNDKVLVLYLPIRDGDGFIVGGI